MSKTPGLNPGREKGRLDTAVFEHDISSGIFPTQHLHTGHSCGLPLKSHHGIPPNDEDVEMVTLNPAIVGVFDAARRFCGDSTQKNATPKNGVIPLD